MSSVGAWETVPPSLHQMLLIQKSERNDSSHCSTLQQIELNHKRAKAPPGNVRLVREQGGRRSGGGRGFSDGFGVTEDQDQGLQRQRWEQEEQNGPQLKHIRLT